MTEHELIAWGDVERELRIQDLKAGLVVAQRNAEDRRKKVGLSLEEATRAVIEANRRKRKDIS